ncbi:tyrosine-type recombinase/integrase [Saccharothrix saharensis]|uniref:tyrosine-type recombinase/integrase n=1 Tax=Saccharothrix saharensis TaxID=571190 RepID=UPI0036859A8D
MADMEATGDAAVSRVGRGDVTVALRVLQRMNLTPEDLVAAVAARTVPTFTELVPEVVEAMPAGSRRAYGSYVNKMTALWGSRRLDEVDPHDVRRFLSYVRETAQVRRSGVGGTGAERHAYHALSFVYRYAVDHELISVRQNVMRLVTAPAMGESRRYALSPQLVSDIMAAARSTGHDPVLDVLILRFHLETAARRGGALALRVCDLDPDQSLVRLREKNSTQRWQPVSPTLMEHLLHHARDRGARDEEDRVLRFANGAAVTPHHYNWLWKRLHKLVASARVSGISTHWLRHTTLTWVERNFGYAVARAYAGHAVPKSSQYGVTQVYVKAGLEEVAAALQALTGEPHPLALVSGSAGADDGSSPPPGPVRMGVGLIGRSSLCEWLREGIVEEGLVEQIRRLYEEADQAGKRRPGRKALARATGASVRRVEMAQVHINGSARLGWLDDLVERIRRLYEEADQAGKRRPGRGRLMAATGANQYRVTLAIAAINGVVRRPVSTAAGPGVSVGPPESPTVEMTSGAGRGRWR